MHIFELYWNESACRKRGRLGLELVLYSLHGWTKIGKTIYTLDSSIRNMEVSLHVYIYLFTALNSNTIYLPLMIPPTHTNMKLVTIFYFWQVQGSCKYGRDVRYFQITISKLGRRMRGKYLRTKHETSHRKG